MLDKFLTGENVKVNGEIANRRNILRTLTPLLCQTCYYQTQKWWERKLMQETLYHCGMFYVDS
jgi:hypothetical protein